MKFTRYPRTVFLFAFIAWLGVVGYGLRLVWAHENSPGRTVTPPTTWPTDSLIRRKPGLPTIVLFIHPHCPCSRATIGELALLMAHSQGLVNVNAVFLKAEGAEGWENTDLWSSAAHIPGVQVSIDEDGIEARRFKSQTSGQVALYSAEGRLLFSGGITRSRGHAGDNDGRTAIYSLLTRGNAAKNKTPVFGCSLVNQNANDQAKEFCDAKYED